jgi:hypothetical protein
MATPDFAIGLKVFSDAFLKLISMIVAPIVFCVVVHGIAGAGDLKKGGDLHPLSHWPGIAAHAHGLVPRVASRLAMTDSRRLRTHFLVRSVATLAMTDAPLTPPASGT